MYYVKKVDGIVVEGPSFLSSDRTASPNTAWKADQLAAHGFELVADPEIPVDPVDPLKSFDYTIFEGRMIQVIPRERWFQLSVSTGVAYSMMRLIEYPGRSIDNFIRFKAFVAGLVALQVLTAEEQTAIYSLFLEQGVDLSAL